MLCSCSRLGLVLAAFGSVLQVGAFSWAIQAGAMAPQGAMASSPLVGLHRTVGGQAYGLHFEWGLDNVDALRLRFADTGTGNQGERIPLDASKGITAAASWTIPEVGLDWRRQWTGQEAGWYTAVGLAVASPRLNWTEYAPLWSGGPVAGSSHLYQQNHKVPLRVGAGYQLNRRFHAELAWHYLKVEGGGPDGFALNQLTWLDLSVGINFGRGR